MNAAVLSMPKGKTPNIPAPRWSAVFAAIIALFFIDAPQANAGNTWDGGGGDGNWGTGDNWNPNGAPVYGTLTFSGSTRTENTNNSITAMNILLWTGTSPWTLRSSGGTVLSLFDFGGAQAKLENQSTGTISLYADIRFAATTGAAFGEINAVNGDMLFLGGTLTVNGSSVNGIKMFSGGNTVAYDNTVAASGKWFGMTAAGVNMEIGGSFTSGDIYVMNNGTLDLKVGSSLSTSAIRLGGDFGNTGNQNLTQSGTLVLSDTDGGYTLGTIVNSVAGNTSGSLLIDSQNTSGTMTINGGIALDSNLKIQQETGGTLSITTSAVEIKTHNLQLDASGAINISSNVTATARSGTLSLLGGTTTLSGSNSGNLKLVLNSGSILSVAAISNLGAPSDTFFGDKLSLDGGTLKVTDNITAAANFGITVSANGGAIDVDTGKTLTLQDFITDGTATGQTLTKSGSGTLFFDKTGINGLDGTTIKVAEGVLNISNTGLLPSGLQLGDASTSGTFRYNNSGAAGTSSIGIALNAGGGAIEVAQQGFTASGVISGAGGLTKTGTNSLILSGASANTYAGATVVSAGTLNLNKTAGVNAIAGAVEVRSNAVLLLSASNQVDSSEAGDTVTLSGGTIRRGGNVSEVFGNLSVTTASFLDYGAANSTGTLSFGTYTPTVLLTVQNFLPGNVLTFRSDLTSSVNNASLFSLGAQGFTSSWSSGTSTFTITAIPEPSTYVAAAGLLALFLWPARRRLIKDAKSILGLCPTGRA